MNNSEKACLRPVTPVSSMLKEKFGLTRMEALVLEGIWLGKTSAQMAEEFGNKKGTVEFTTSSLYRRIGTNNRVKAALLVERAL